MVRFDAIEKVARLAKALAVAAKKYDAKRERYLKTSMASPNHAQKQSVDLATDAHHIEVLEAELHAACVDAGLAEPKDASEYEERIWRMSAWHEYKWTPALPKRLAAESTAQT